MLIIPNESLTVCERDWSYTCKTLYVSLYLIYKEVPSRLNLCLFDSSTSTRTTCYKSLGGLSLITCVCVYNEGDYVKAHLKHKCMLSLSADMSPSKANQLNELHRDRQISRALRFITSPIIVSRHPAGPADEPVMSRVCVLRCVYERVRRWGRASKAASLFPLEIFSCQNINVAIL